MNSPPSRTAPAGALDLSALYRRCLFRSDAAVESHDHVSRELSDHDLHWRGGAVDTAMFKAELCSMSMFALRYGAEVEVRPRPFEDFFLMHMSLRGAADIESDGQRICIPEGRSALIAPRRDIRMWWQRGSEQFILKVPTRLLDTMTAGRPLPAAALMPEGSEAQWRLMLQSLVLTSALQNGSTAHQNWVEHFEQNIALFLGAQHGQEPSPSVAPPQPASTASATEQRIEAMETYMRRRLAAPVALADLAGAAGVGIRTLGVLCQRHRGTSPMDLLRGMRLDAARARLQTGDASVTQAALEYGFGHLGRFSAYYRERFGELPRETPSH